jgi:DNA-binding phage protein
MSYIWEVPASVPYDDYLIESLKNQRRAEAYLNAALEDHDPRVFLMALRNVAQARSSTNKVQLE